MKLSRWLVASVTLQGRGHQAAGVACQDRVAVGQRGDLVAVALADGASSASHAEVGASEAVASVCATLLDGFADLAAAPPERLPELLLQPLQIGQARLAASLGVPRHALASTLLFVAVDRQRYLAGNLGDGVVGCLRARAASVVLHPRTGEHHNETFFATSRRAADHLEVARGALDRRDGFCLMTDGAAEVLYNRRARRLVAAPAQAAAWLTTRPPADVEGAFARALRAQTWERTADDCSVVLLRRVQLSPAALGSATPEFQRAMLACATLRGARHRLRVLTAAAACTAPGDMARATGLSASTVRRHLRALRPWLDEPDPDLGPAADRNVASSESGASGAPRASASRSRST